MGKDEIAAIEHRFINAGVEELMTYLDEAHVRYDFMPPLQLVGAKAVRAALEMLFAGFKTVNGEFISLDVVATEEMGVAYSLQYFTWTSLDDKPAEATFRVTHCFHKVKGEWKIFHSHVSFPTNPATGMAEMNLKG